MGREGENSIKCRQVSGGEGGSSKGAAKVRCSTEKFKRQKDVHQDPREDGSQDGFQGPPQGPSKPLSTLPLDVEEKKGSCCLYYSTMGLPLSWTRWARDSRWP